VCVVVKPENFENVTNAVVNDHITLTCSASPGTRIVWLYQQGCDDFQHGLYICSNPSVIDIGSQYQTRVNKPGEHSLMINGATTNMTGVYTLKNLDNDRVLCQELLNVISKYVSVILSFPSLYLGYMNAVYYVEQVHRVQLESLQEEVYKCYS